MKNKVGFGIPIDYVHHHFYIEIPSKEIEQVAIYEDYGMDARPRSECRCIISKETWDIIKDIPQMDFNKRLHDKKQRTSEWAVGTNKIDRFLGREICVLFWAVEQAQKEEYSTIVSNWRGLRPEERWWFFSKIVADAGLESDKDKGWRKAIYHALSQTHIMKWTKINQGM